MWRSWPVLLAVWLLHAGAAQAQVASAAEAPGIVLWLESGDGDARSIERALRLELGSRGMLLTSGEPAAAAGAAGDEAASARVALEHSSADVALWLHGDPQQRVTWLRVLRRESAQVEQAPLAHGSAPVDAELVAIAAAALLDQVLSAPVVAPPPSPTPQAVAAAAPRPAGSAAHITELDPTPPALRARPVATRMGAQPAAGRSIAARRWFVQLGASFAMASVSGGMEADRPPPDDQVFDEDGLFRTDSAWVPDADSEDAFGTPISDCPADDVATSEDEAPSKWCARVPNATFVLVPATRLSIGYWLLPDVALAVLYQWHVGIRTASLLESHLFGLQGELRMLRAGLPAVMFSALAGATVGRTDTPVPMPSADSGPGPDARSGPLGAHVGLRSRITFPNGIGLFLSPTVGARFPALQFTMELEMGVEVWF